MKKFKKVISLLLVVACLLQVCNNSYLALAENNTQQKINTTSLDGIKANNDTNWSYVIISGTTETPMVYSASSSGMIIDNPASNDQWAKLTTAGNGNSHPANSCDIAAVYNVQADGKLDLGLRASIHNAGGDGVQVKVYLNSTTDMLLNPTVVQKADGTKEFIVQNISVKAGDKIYFVLNKNSSLSTDGGTFVASVKTAEEAKINTTSLDGIKANNDTNWSYVIISGTTETPMVYSASSSGMIIDNPASNDQWAKLTTAGNGNSHPANSCDIAAVYNVQADGKLDLGLRASIHNAGGDGVQVKVYLNSTTDMLLNPTVVQKADGTKEFIVQNISVKAGDKIYFVLNKNSSLSTDGGTFVASVKTTEEEQTIDTTSTDGIVADNKTNWSYVSIIGETETAMVFGKYSNTYPAMMINNPASNDQYARMLADGGSHPSNSGDIAAVYTVPKDVVLDCTITAKVNNASSDGVRVKMWVNAKENYLLTPSLVKATDGQVEYKVPSVSVKAGDKIYFGLDKNGGLSNDAGKFFAKVKTAEKVASNQVYSGGILASQADYGYSYVYISDEGEETAMTYDVSSSSYMNGYSGKSYTVEDDATAFYNDKYQAGAATSGYTAQVYTVPVDGKINLKLSVKPNNATSYDGDGYGIAIALNDFAVGGLEDWTFITKDEAQSGTEKNIEKDINAKTGDKIYFLYTKNGGNEGSYKPSFDTTILKATIMYTEKIGIAEQERTTGNVELIASANPNNVKVGSVHKSSESFGPTPKYNFSYKTVSVPDNVIGDMLYESTTNSYRKTLDKNQVDYWGYFSKNSAGTASVGDTLTVYTMPCKAKVSIEINAKVMKEKSDGVAVSISRNTLTNVLHESQVIEYAADADVTTIKKEIVANQGDVIYVRLNKNGVNSYDTVQFDVIVTYLELNPEDSATEGETVHPLVGTTTDFKTALTNKETGVWSYQKIKLADNTISDMSYEYTTASNSHSYRCSLNADDLNYWGYVNSTGVMGSATDYDVLVVYTAPEKVKINVTWNVQVAREKSDGAVFSIFRNDYQNVIGKRNVLQYEDGKQVLEYNGIVLNKGDKLYFRLNKKGSNSYDSIATNIFIKCIEVNPIENATEGNTKLVIEQGTEIQFNQDANTTWGGNGFYYYASGIGTEDFYKLVYNTKLGCYTFPANTINDEWVRIGTSGNVRTGNKYDPIIVYQVQNNAKITVKVKCKSLATNGDGVRVKLLRNEQKIAPTDARWCIVQGENQFEYTTQINVAKGEYIMLRVNRNALNSYDNLDVQFSIIYDEIYEKAPIGSVQGVKLPSCLPCEKELETASVLNHPSHVNRVPFEGEVSGLTGRAKNSVSVSAEIPKDYLEESSGKKLLWVYVTSGICLLVLIGGTVCGVYFKKRKTKEIITEQKY